ncbi:hypothetical protein KAR91_29920 [Candidatus Pacearchaeota archaeon]|nr:hypothetical protein [Candidatus Pacearchaeota archaeon]
MAILDEYSEFTFKDVEESMERLKSKKTNRPNVYYFAGVDCFIDADTGKVVENRPLSNGGRGWQISQ